MCEGFLEDSEKVLESLQNDVWTFKKYNHSEMVATYSQFIQSIEDIAEEMYPLLQTLNDFDETTKRMLYSQSQHDQIQEHIAKISEIKNGWQHETALELVEEQQEKTALTNLQEMIGLTDVKRRIQQFYQFLKFQKDRKEAGFLTKDEISLNMVLLGNPGTGKTTIARLLARIYHELGVLPSEEVIETNRSQLVGSYVGQTEENVRQIVEKASGGVLFIDEAYTLKRVDQSGSDYGQTVIDTLVSLMTSKEYGGKFSVILAGYPEEMRQFLDANTGLRSRFPQSNVIELPDYSTKELIQIGEQIAIENDFLITYSC